MTLIIIYYKTIRLITNTTRIYIKFDQSLITFNKIAEKIEIYHKLIIKLN